MNLVPDKEVFFGGGGVGGEGGKLQATTVLSPTATGTNVLEKKRSAVTLMCFPCDDRPENISHPSPLLPPLFSRRHGSVRWETGKKKLVLCQASLLCPSDFHLY